MGIFTAAGGSDKISLASHPSQGTIFDEIDMDDCPIFSMEADLGEDSHL